MFSSNCPSVSCFVFASRGNAAAPRRDDVPKYPAWSWLFARSKSAFELSTFTSLPIRVRRRVTALAGSPSPRASREPTANASSRSRGENILLARVYRAVSTAHAIARTNERAMRAKCFRRHPHARARDDDARRGTHTQIDANVQRPMRCSLPRAQAHVARARLRATRAHVPRNLTRTPTRSRM